MKKFARFLGMLRRLVRRLTIQRPCWICSSCGWRERREQEVLCWKCGWGVMEYHAMPPNGQRRCLLAMERAEAERV